MQQLTQEYLDSCSRSDGFIMRGENMTRIETFVDAAFAFAMTMLIISVDEIPNSAESLFVSLRDIPAFLASAANIGLIWYWHSTFSRRFGLQDSRTTMLSFALVMLMLIFIYPLKLVFMGLFAWLSSGYLSPGLETMHIDELSNLFVYFGLGFFSYGLIGYFLIKNVLKFKDELRLTDFEIYQVKTDTINWIVIMLISIGSIILATSLSGMWITLAGFIYSFLFISGWLITKLRDKQLSKK